MRAQLSAQALGCPVKMNRFSAAALLFVLHSQAFAHTPVWHSLTGKICVEREENGGSMNVVPSRVRVNYPGATNAARYEILLNSGGEGGCVLVSPGKYEVQVFAMEAYLGKPGPERCTSKPFLVVVKAGGTAELNIWPRNGKGGYDPCGWEVLPHGTPQPHNCMQAHRPPECGNEP